MKKKLILLAASLAMLIAAAALALAQTEPGTQTEPPGDSIRGFITNISGDVVLVEEDPADESGSAKGAFTVSGETEIFTQQSDGLVPATFDDLQVGQLVSAMYVGPVAESYPTQGTAGGIVILGEPPTDELRCLIPEGCDLDGDGVADLEAGEPIPTGAVQYDNAV